MPPAGALRVVQIEVVVGQQRQSSGRGMDDGCEAREATATMPIRHRVLGVAATMNKA